MNLIRRRPYTYYRSIVYLISRVKHSNQHLYHYIPPENLSGILYKDVIESSVLRSLLG